MNFYGIYLLSARMCVSLLRHLRHLLLLLTRCSQHDVINVVGHHAVFWNAQLIGDILDNSMTKCKRVDITLRQDSEDVL